MKHVDIQRSKTKHEPLRTYEECAEALGITPAALTGRRARQTALPFPKAVFKHNTAAGVRSYYRLSEVRRWNQQALEGLNMLATNKAAFTFSHVRIGLLAELSGVPL